MYYVVKASVNDRYLLQVEVYYTRLTKEEIQKLFAKGYLVSKKKEYATLMLIGMMQFIYENCKPYLSPFDLRLDVYDCSPSKSPYLKIAEDTFNFMAQVQKEVALLSQDISQTIEDIARNGLTSYYRTDCPSCLNRLVHYSVIGL